MWKVENRYYDGARVRIDSERVKESMVGRSWNIVSAVVQSHVTELALEINPCVNPAAGESDKCKEGGPAEVRNVGGSAPLEIMGRYRSVDPLQKTRRVISLKIKLV